MSKDEINNTDLIRVNPSIIYKYNYIEKTLYIVLIEIIHLSHICIYGKISIYDMINKTEYGKFIYNIFPLNTHYSVDDEMLSRMRKYFSEKEKIIKSLVRKMYLELPKIDFSLFEDFNNILN